MMHLQPAQYESWLKKVDDPDWTEHRYRTAQDRAMASAIRDLRDAKQLERVADEMAEVLLEQIISQGCACHFLDESLQPCLKCRTDAALASYAKWKGK